MTSCTEFHPTSFAGFSASRAQGPDAAAVQSLFSEVQDNFRASQSLGEPARKTLVNLVDTFLDCFHTDWDGYDALAVGPQTYHNTRRFLETLTGAWPQPSVAADPDGEISLEWYRGPRMRFSVSIGPDATVSYAGMFGTSTVHGTETFIDEVPDGIIQHLRRLYRLPA